jgi:large subunit ribosomal protein L17
MRHLNAGRKLSRNASHRRALYRNLALALIRHEQIITTVAKAKAVRPFVEKLITLAKRNTLHARRLVIARLGTASKAELEPDGDDDRDVLTKLFSEIGPRFANRPGGYTRIVKRHERRLGDAGETAFLELLKEGETKVQKKRTAAPAPRVEAPTTSPRTETPQPATSAESPPSSDAPPETPATPPTT